MRHLQGLADYPQANRMTRRTISVDEVKRLFSYDPQTGVVSRLVSRGGATLGPVGLDQKEGEYPKVTICGHCFRLHQIAWVLMTGEWADGAIDHKNRDRSDNRWRNLRLATPAQNLLNTSAHARSQTGLKGVSWHKASGKWRVQVNHGGRVVFTGLAQDLEVADELACFIREEVHGEFACH